MKRGLSYFICVNIIISIFVGGLISTNSVNAYQILNTGDQLLYEEVIYDHYTGSNQYWYEFEPGYPYDYLKSYWNVYDDQYFDMKLHSYVTTNAIDPNQVWSNHTSSKYDLYNHHYYEDYKFDYGTSYSWFLDYTNDYYNYDNYNYSSFYWDQWFPANPSVINFDFSHNFGTTVFNGTTSMSFTINGASRLLSIDIYDYYYSSPSSWLSDYYGISYTQYETFTHSIRYYVDSTTGIIISMDEQTRYVGYYSFSDYSTELGTNVVCNVDYDEQNIYKWTLTETSAAYTPAATDLDLPGALFGAYDTYLTNSDTEIQIPIYIENIGSTVTVEIYIDYNLYDVRTLVPSGQNLFVIPEGDIPYDGPNYWHWIRFDIYDDYDFKYNSTWEINFQDLRTYPPTWSPSWIEGSSYVTIDAGENLDVPFMIYSDTNWTVDIYKDEGIGYVFYNWWDGYQNNTRWLWDSSLSVGTYEYLLHFYDNVGVIQDLYITVDVVPPDAPKINGPFGDYWYTIGDVETKIWQFQDNDPDSYDMKLDGVSIDNGTYIDGQTVYFDLKNWITSPGDYHLEIIAWDYSTYIVTLDLYIHTTDTDLDSPIITGPIDPIYMNAGEDKELVWNLYDDNPERFKVWENGTLIADEIWTINSIDIIIDLSILENGTWFYEVEAFDVFGFSSYKSIHVYIGEDDGTEPIDPTEPEDPGNTVNLDAPGVVYVAIGFLSIAALSIIIRKRR